jgi:hypothetical protein
MSTSSAAILQVAQAIGNGNIRISEQELIRILLSALGVTRITFWEINESCCEIVAGIPLEAHGIAENDLLSKHPDVEFLLMSPEKDFNLIRNPSQNPLTQYFVKTIQEVGINAILYVKIQKQGKCCVIVADATEDRIDFSLPEKKLCQEFGELVVARMVSYNEFLFTFYEKIKGSSLQELRHLYFTDFSAASGLLKRVVRKLKNLTDGRKDEDQISIKNLREILVDAEEMDRCNTKLEQSIPLTMENVTT